MKQKLVWAPSSNFYELKLADFRSKTKAIFPGRLCRQLIRTKFNVDLCIMFGDVIFL